jgi:predicted dithiol-disulfide oxidoreductase (DUF899 family)
MFGDGYTAGCPVNSSIADSVNGLVPHLNARDVTMVFVSRAPIKKLLAYKQRMGWSFPWVSAGGSDFNFDFGISSTEEAAREWAMPMLERGEMPPARRDLQQHGADGPR